MMMHQLILAATICGIATSGLAVDATNTTAKPEQSPIVLWPGGASDALGQRDVDIPTLTPYPASPDTATGAAMVVCPGGGYHALADHEGRDYARYLNELGITAFVLKYRLSSAGYHHPSMLNDITRAIRIVRADADKWKIDRNRVGVMGSSAGGHLVATLLTHYDKGNPNSTDTIEQQSSRPDLGILCYPVITMGKLTHAGSKHNLLGDSPSPELVKLLSDGLQVTPDTAPTFIFSTADDQTVPVQNSLMFATALADAKVSFELHIYPHGKHGMGLGTKKWDPANRHSWTKACAAWLKQQNFAK